MPVYASIALLLVCAVAPGWTQDSNPQNKKIDVETPGVSLHVGDDADAKKIGLPLYPGARRKSDGEDKNQANLSLLTEAFGTKLIVAKYLSDDTPAQVLDFYRGKLKKFGKVVECHSSRHGGDIEVNDDDKDSAKGQELKCDENSGPVVELKVGTENNQRVVAVEPGDGGKGTGLALVYVYTRGKRGDI
jgi:hypothetical protein